MSRKKQSVHSEAEKQRVRWWQVTDFETPDLFTPLIWYSIVWVNGKGYFLTSPQYPGIHVAVKVL